MSNQLTIDQIKEGMLLQGCLPFKKGWNTYKITQVYSTNGIRCAGLRRWGLRGSCFYGPEHFLPLECLLHLTPYVAPEPGMTKVQLAEALAEALTILNVVDLDEKGQEYVRNLHSRFIPAHITEVLENQSPKVDARDLLG